MENKVKLFQIDRSVCPPVYSERLFEHGIYSKYAMILKTSGSAPPSKEISLGVNVSWFNTWDESQPLANVALQARKTDSSAIAVDDLGNPTSDLDLYIYEGGNPGGAGAGGGSQYGAHLCSFTGQAGSITGGGGTVSNIAYNSGTNTTTFTYTTTGPTNSSITLTNTKRTSGSSVNTGVTNFKMMRPGHTSSDFINSAFITAMQPFSCFRVGPQWSGLTYSTTAPVWSIRPKPGGMFRGCETNAAASIPWEVLIKMANDMGIDLWICLPPNADNTYLTNIFNIFMYGSDGNNPYTSTQANPVWAPLNANRKLYFEVGNEVWNAAPPYGTITDQMDTLGAAEIAAGDAHYYQYDGNAAGYWGIVRRRLAYLTVNASLICRSIVGDSRMMTQFRPVIAGQNAWDHMGSISLSYIKCVYGGYNWFNDNNGDDWPGLFNSLVYVEDGAHTNSFGIIARPITYYIYGYAAAPYVTGSTISALQTSLITQEANMSTNINLAKNYGVIPLCYEGGISDYPSYTDAGQDTVIEDMLNYWFSNGGSTFCYFSFAGNNHWGIYSDLTKQDENTYPRVKAVRTIAGLT